MKVTYKMSFADYKAGYRMYRRGTFFLRYDQLIWPAVTILCFIVFTIFRHQSEISQQVAGLFFCSLWFTFGLPVLRTFNAYRGYRASLQNGRLSLETTTEITDERIVDVTPGICELTYTWSSIKGFGQDDKITIFRTSGAHFLFFPTSSLNADQRVELNELVSRHGIRRWS
jgi:hypothetical protein